MPALASLLTAVDRNTRSPHTIGLETDTPGTGVFHNTFSPVTASHFTGVGVPSATPDAAGPRNIGQFWADNVTQPTHHIATKTRNHENMKSQDLVSCVSWFRGFVLAEVAVWSCI